MIPFPKRRISFNGSWIIRINLAVHKKLFYIWKRALSLPQDNSNFLKLKKFTDSNLFTEFHLLYFFGLTNVLLGWIGRLFLLLIAHPLVRNTVDSTFWQEEWYIWWCAVCGILSHVFVHCGLLYFFWTIVQLESTECEMIYVINKFKEQAEGKNPSKLSKGEWANKTYE